MKTRRRTVDSVTPLPNTENIDTSSSASAAAPLTTATATTSDEATVTTTSKSDVWEYFKRCTNVIPLKAQCLLCDNQLLTPNYATSSLKRHLAQIHGLQQFGSTEVPCSTKISINLSKTEKQKLDSLAVDAIIKDERAFGDFEKSGLTKFINALKPGYKPSHRNSVVKKLKRLHQQHTIQTKTQFEVAKYLSITCDFWTNRQQKSFLVITGHYVDKDFNQHSKVLKFIMFEERHFSALIAQEIEKQLISLDLYDKLVTITCDGASNMRVVQDYTNEDNDEDNPENTLNELIRSMSVDLHHLPNDNNNEENENNDSSKDDKDDEADDDIQSNNETTEPTSDQEEWIGEDHDEEITDNFIEGVNMQEMSLDDLQQKVREVIDITRELVDTIKRTSILSTFVEKKRLKVNLTLKKDKKIKRRLTIDVKTRWYSTFKMLDTMNIYRDIINDMFKSKGSIGLKAKQRQKLARIELTTDQWDLIDLLIVLLQSFYSATKVLNNTKYATIGSALYIIRRLEEYLETEEKNPVLNSLKAKVMITFQYYLFDDEEQFNTLKLYGYFDPMGFSVLTRMERTAVEKELIKIYKKDFQITTSSPTASDSQQTTKINNVDKAWQEFLKATNTNLQHEVPATATSIQEEIKRYHNSAIKLYVSKIFSRQYTLEIFQWEMDQL